MVCHGSFEKPSTKITRGNFPLPIRRGNRVALNSHGWKYHCVLSGICSLLFGSKSSRGNETNPLHNVPNRVLSISCQQRAGRGEERVSVCSHKTRTAGPKSKWSSFECYVWVHTVPALAGKSGWTASPPMGAFAHFQAHYFGLCHWFYPSFLYCFLLATLNPLPFKELRASGRMPLTFTNLSFLWESLTASLLCRPVFKLLGSGLNQMAPAPYFLYFPQLKPLSHCWCLLTLSPCGEISLTYRWQLDSRWTWHTSWNSFLGLYSASSPRATESAKSLKHMPLFSI